MSLTPEMMPAWELLPIVKEQAARIAQLEAALRPLACTCKEKHPEGCSSGEVDCPFWNALAALKGRP
jgi:hypothetical protein